MAPIACASSIVAFRITTASFVLMPSRPRERVSNMIHGGLKPNADHCEFLSYNQFYEAPDIASGAPAVIRLPDRRVSANATGHSAAKAEAAARPGQPGAQYPDWARTIQNARDRRSED